jgi:ABC-type branched-subunit amino acid transport system permease subunit
MVNALAVLVNAVIISALYALVAIGFTLIFGVGGVLNLAHGASITVGAFGAYFATRVFGLGIVVGLLAGIAAAAVFSGLLYLVMIERIEDQPITVMILTLVTAIATEQLLLNMLGGQPKAIPSLVPGSVALGPVSVQANLLVVFVLSWLVIGGLFLVRRPYESREGPARDEHEPQGRGALWDRLLAGDARDVGHRRRARRPGRSLSRFLPLGGLGNGPHAARALVQHRRARRDRLSSG